MKLIVGLGNPGAEYQRSRHNIGFCLVDRLAKKWDVPLNRKKHKALYGSLQRRAEQIVLLKPQTYMNLSGGSVSSAMAFYKVLLSDVLVIVDDMALDLGRVRLRSQGSAGGHNGLKDIIAHIGDGFARMRIGIGAARRGDAINHVLGEFSAEEDKILTEALDRSVKAVECWLDRGIDEAMTRYNKPPKDKSNENREKDSAENGQDNSL
ncbi:MAG: aminoacyl-tRNA hydrolase [Sedimentisphaerales bacterium]|nr:aminoacyl-tRNA hydrolase [Sedimentisphaerales bacterium]